MEPGKLYWFPGTKIIGGITIGGLGFSFSSEPPAVDCNAPPQDWAANVPILDTAGHGTMTASRAASVEYGACPGCLLVAIQGFTADAVHWAASNSSWIDAQSNSWGPILPAWSPVPVLDPPVVNDSGFVRTVERAARRHLSFWSTGNGVATRGGALGHPTITDPRMTPSIVMVGAHDSGYVTTWPGFPPHVVSDGCQSWAAHARHMDESDGTVGSGTSAAAPFAAGGAARLLVEARRLLGDRDTGVDGKGKIVASAIPDASLKAPSPTVV